MDKKDLCALLMTLPSVLSADLIQNENAELEAKLMGKEYFSIGISDTVEEVCGHSKTERPKK